MKELTDTEKRMAVRWMQQHCGFFRDKLTDEINCTAMAESAADQLGLLDGDDVPEDVFDIAVDVELAMR